MFVTTSYIVYILIFKRFDFCPFLGITYYTFVLRRIRSGFPWNSLCQNQVLG